MPLVLGGDCGLVAKRGLGAIGGCGSGGWRPPSLLPLRSWWNLFDAGAERRSTPDSQTNSRRLLLLYSVCATLNNCSPRVKLSSLPYRQSLLRPLTLSLHTVSTFPHAPLHSLLLLIRTSNPRLLAAQHRQAGHVPGMLFLFISLPVSPL